MLIEVKGIVVRTRELRGSDKYLTIFTEERGLVSAIANGSRSLKSRYLAATQLFSYASYMLEYRNDCYYVRDTELLESFFALRLDIVRTALGNYICEVASDTVVPEQPESEFLRLVLNSLYAIAAGKHSLTLIKAAFEFRAAALLGFSPEPNGCAACGSDEEEMFLDIMNGNLLCRACRNRLQNELPTSEDDFRARTRVVLAVLTPAALRAVDYVIHAPLERLLSFRLEPEDSRHFAHAAEEYLLHHLGRGFRTLAFYKEMAAETV